LIVNPLQTLQKTDYNATRLKANEADEAQEAYEAF